MYLVKILGNIFGAGGIYSKSTLRRSPKKEEGEMTEEACDDRRERNTMH